MLLLQTQNLYTYRMNSDRWKIVTKDPSIMNDEIDRLFNDGLAAAPSNYLNEDVIAMLPKKAVTGICRICGNTNVLTKEHIPLRSSGNKDRSTSYSLSQWLENKNIENMGKGKVTQGGIYGFTLCRDCNSATGAKYGNEYKDWSHSGVLALQSIPLDEINGRVGPFAQKIQFGTKNKPVNPGAMVRQVISMMCSLSGTWDIAGMYPDIRKILLGGESIALPAELDLGMVLYAGPRSRIVGPQLKVDVKTMTWQWVMEMAYPPFAFQMVLASSTKATLNGIVMNEWSLKKTKEPMVFMGEIEVGFGWSPYPADYRTLYAINKD